MARLPTFEENSVLIDLLEIGMLRIVNFRQLKQFGLRITTQWIVVKFDVFLVYLATCQFVFALCAVVVDSMLI